jgi:hypothetical protein
MHRHTQKNIRVLTWAEDLLDALLEEKAIVLGRDHTTAHHNNVAAATRGWSR